MCFCVVGVLPFAELVLMCDSRKCSASDVRVGNGGHGGFLVVAFFPSVLDFCEIVDLSSLYLSVFSVCLLPKATH